MRFGVIGSGMVGQTLAAGLTRLGHEVVAGTRDPGKLEACVGEHPGVRAAPNAEAAAFGGMILLATKWEGTREALELAGAENLNGEVVVDSTNPLDFSGGRPTLGWNTSAGEQMQGWVPGARVVKAFNTVTADAMLNPREFVSGEPHMFTPGNDAGATGEVTRLLEGVGWGAVDLGDATKSRSTGSLAPIWMTYGFNSGWTTRLQAAQPLKGGGPGALSWPA